MLATMWWLSFWTACGLTVGSFLNVVIYRLPRGRSLHSPRWSTCTNCRRRIAWYDNIPIVSFLILKGRCRRCRVPISTRYLFIEAAMAVIVLLLIDAFFVSGARPGLADAQFGLTDQLAFDWPILVGHIILFACLLSMSAIDLEHYWVDVRFTNFATIAGFALHALWTPTHSNAWGRPMDTTALMSIMAVAGLAAVWVFLICQPHQDPEDFGLDPSTPSTPESDAPTKREKRPQHELAELYTPRTRAAGWAMLAVFVLLFVSVALAGIDQRAPLHWCRVLLPLALFFVIIVRESTVSRDSDKEIESALEEERHGARQTVLWEFSLLAPAILLAWVAYSIMQSDAGIASTVGESLAKSTRILPLDMFRHWSPLQGLATAACGYVIAGGLGWFVRILFTLLFGKEALGTGDIHLLAATGCVAGWPVAVLGFAIASFLAVAGWVMVLPFKRSRAVPLGPWLALAFLIVVVQYDAIVGSPLIQNSVAAVRMLLSQNSQM